MNALVSMTSDYEQFVGERLWYDRCHGIFWMPCRGFVLNPLERIHGIMLNPLERIPYWVDSKSNQSVDSKNFNVSYFNISRNRVLSFNPIEIYRQTRFQLHQHPLVSTSVKRYDPHIPSWLIALLPLSLWKETVTLWAFRCQQKEISINSLLSGLCAGADVTFWFVISMVTGTAHWVMQSALFHECQFSVSGQWVEPGVNNDLPHCWW